MNRRWNAVRHRLRAARPPSLHAPDLWPRIVAPSAAPVEVLPWRDPKARVSSWVVVGLLGLLVLLLIVVLRRGVPTDTSPGDLAWYEGAMRAASEIRFLPPAAFAQAGTPSSLPPVTSIDPAKLGTGRWTYQSWLVSEGKRQPVIEWDTLTVFRTEEAGQPAIALISSSTRREGMVIRTLDSLLLRGTDGRVLQQFQSFTWGDRSDRPKSWMVAQFTGDTARGRIVFPRQERSWTAVVPAGSHALPLAFFELLPTLPLADRRAVSLQFLGISPDPRDTTRLPVHTVELRVVGREQVSVPAGRFESWRLELSSPPAERSDNWGMTVWVDTLSGRMVRTRSGHRDGTVRERQLVSVIRTP